MAFVREARCEGDEPGPWTRFKGSHDLSCEEGLGLKDGRRHSHVAGRVEKEGERGFSLPRLLRLLRVSTGREHRESNVKVDYWGRREEQREWRRGSRKGSDVLSSFRLRFLG
ncbi:hypothetical protein HAX54_050931 [Datura stramonium]|uniref:Uncharacterized protein n=1 Tax=Datura stramonium TaxID=4076 RepID=A0ABS8WQR7_DATST|nr:hypothetical protein [Datura stramonium]